MQVMMVCTGNICRSAMAEVVLKDMLQPEGGTGAVSLTRSKSLGDRVKEITVDSCGVSAEEQGNPMDYRAEQVLRENGYPLKPEHSARRIELVDLQNTDLLLAMTFHHYQVLERLIAQAEATGQLSERRPELRLLREFEPAHYQDGQGLTDQRLTRRGVVPDVEDPWYGSIRDFRTCLATIERCLPNVLDYLCR